MRAQSDLSPSSVSELRSKLKGVRVEVGSLVSFRDEPAFEMVMRLNKRHNGNLVSAVLSKGNAACGLGGDASGSGEGIGEGRVMADRSRHVEELRMVFIPKAYGAFLEDEMQKWLDPFRGRGEANRTKRKRDEVDDNEVTDIDSDVDTDECDDADSFRSV
ncbi:TFIIH basal transcription factor subunit [Trypanosoma equiperdum]|uniref:TFIIH basal transcription factor subunit n=4 Tax=Trypanozoon TaxID=39700 RepID=Q388I1_TRYB2|nr:hypothetical protein, conserved [Trypanosoma brucei gambiense DAL972]XP_827901.1 hypothetical protein, conserved [Trypanosoma brucei brucei TREU927]RHW69718.1 TFIIH basal transcription factor subunit [Trypanosoma brucei equiperdum]SCU66521.1 TFIIH basal transcription factor subunit [Trypanosoma equiperdum]EAN78789.1 hypothetical protein, conserved [Trypanosoma brucei brucei TREU927]CBH16557.1 hypothetical protein, conserved [Trypanosoma brucei gambiense DAL972]|eukprot:XP_011778821.1 hypothetical protein, conserved [Trypanosoma brucei gambiense DAL972]